MLENLGDLVSNFPMDEELEQLQREINLTEYAAAQGYCMDRRASSRNSIVMRKEEDKIVVAIGYTGKWIYFSVRDEEDNGTIVDFVQFRTGKRMGHVRQALRPWMGAGRPRVAIELYAPEVLPVSPDREQVLRQFHQFRECAAHPYLVQERGLSVAVLSDPRFARRIYIDRHRNAVFPHQDRDGVCGFEIKNARYTGFSRQGVKGLWFSRVRPEDRRLVISETAIDALSFHALQGDGLTRYCSIAGRMNALQPDLLVAAMGRLPGDATVVAATDNDAQGRALAQELGALAERAGRRFEVALPEGEGRDWNEVLFDAPMKHEGD